MTRSCSGKERMSIAIEPKCDPDVAARIDANLIDMFNALRAEPVSQEVKHLVQEFGYRAIDKRRS